MTSTSPTEVDRKDWQSRVSYLDARWCSHSEMRVSVDDIGFRQGVIAVERLRTYGGRPFAIEEHLDRWLRTTAELQITDLPRRQAIGGMLLELLERNALLLHQQGDVGITLFATPGGPTAPTATGPTPQQTSTFGMHLNPIRHALIQRRRESGQPVIVTSVRQPPPECWSRGIKVRSRIHYYLADREAAEVDPDAVGVLVDDDASLTETSIANLAIVKEGRILSPVPTQVLRGITQSTCEKLAARIGIDWSTARLNVHQLVGADEVLLMGTDGGIWFANSVDSQPIAEGFAGEIYLRLRAEFDALVASLPA